MNTPEDSNETILGLNPADLLVRGLQSGKAATGSPQAWQPPTPEELAALLPQYEIEALLGRGGMGAVYQGRQAALDRAVAIKLLPAELAADTEFLTRFQREARTLAKLQHPGIVAVHDFGQTSEGHLFFVMEFVNGTDLARLIHGPGVNPAQALEIIAQVCEALQYAHSQGVIHRDIKPANVLINTEGRAKLADFGLARPTSDETASLTRSNVVMGTPDYIAPEQMYGHADHRADLYSLGIMLYEMLTGQTPRGAWAPPSQRVQVDVRLDQVVIRALQQDPAMRYQQASEIKTDVDVIRTTPLPKIGKGKAKTGPEAPGQRTTPLPKAKKPGNKFAIVAALVLLLAATGWWVIQPETKSAASNLPWQKAVWSDQDRARLSDDGWLTTGDELKTSIPERVPGEQLNFADGALRAQVRFEAKPKHRPAMSFWLRMPRERSIQFLITELEFKATLNGDKGAEMGRIAFDTPYQRGDVEHFEVAAVGDRFVAHFKGKQLSFQCPEANRNGSALFHGQSYAIKDVEYLHLDGHPDPLKALGWEVPATAAPAIPWTRIEHTAEEWAKTGQTLKDGWVHNPDKNILLFDRLSAAKATSQFAVRTKVKFHEPESNLNFVNQTAGGHTWRKVQFWTHKLGIINSDRPPATTQRHVTKVELDEEALVEMLVAGDKVYTRFNGQPVVAGDLSPIIPWVQCHLMGGLSYSLRDTEYAILDDIPDPLKALGWEVPESAANKAAAITPSEAVLKARERGGWLRAFGMSFGNPVELGKAAESDSLQSVVIGPDGWAARQENGQTICMSVYWNHENGKAVELGPYDTSFLTRSAFPYMRLRTDGSIRNVYDGGSQHRPDLAHPDAVAYLNPSNYNVLLDLEGRILISRHWHETTDTPIKVRDDRKPPPDDFFLGATAYTVASDHYVSARPGLPVRSFSASSGEIVDFPEHIRDIVEMDTSGKQVIMRDAAGRVFVTSHLGSDYLAPPRDLGPAVAVRAGKSVFAAQMVDGTWRAWGDDQTLVEQTSKIGAAVDVDYYNNGKGKPGYMLWIEPVDDNKAPSSPKDEGWRDFLAELAEGPRKNEQLGIFWKREGSGWRVAKYFTFMIPDETGRDLAIRATGTSSRLSVFARSDYSGSLYASAGFAKIQRSDEVLKQFKLGQNFDSSKGHTVELRAIGNTLTLLIDDKELGSVEDDTHPVGGQFGVTAGEGSLVEKVEYRFLNEPAKTSSITPPSLTQREIAERLLGLKAELRIRQPGKLTKVRFGDKLPEGDFTITEVTYPMTAKATDETFALVAGAPELEKLTANGTISTLVPVAGLKRLKELRIYAGGQDGTSALSEEEMKSLKELSELETVIISHMTFTGHGCRHLVGATNLKDLFFGQKQKNIRPIDEAGAADIAKLKTLTSLSLHGGGVFDPASPAAFRVIAAMPELTHLDLGDMTVTRNMLVEIAKMPKLQSLNLSTCQLESQEFALLAPCAERLTALSFGYDTNLSDTGVKDIAATLVNLKEFILGWTNACTGASLRELARLPKLHDFRYQKRDGLIKPEDFAALTNFPLLNQLSLVSCGLNDECVKPLGRCPNLAAVSLTSNDQITDTALAHLHTSKTIRYVEVTGTQVTDAGIAALKQALPGCEVKR